MNDFTLQITDEEGGTRMDVVTTQERGRFATQEEAQAVQALFAKSALVKQSTCSGGHGTGSTPYLDFTVGAYIRNNKTGTFFSQTTHKSMGDVNETGQRRFNSILKTATKAGWAIDRKTQDERYQEWRLANGYAVQGS